MSLLQVVEETLTRLSLVFTEQRHAEAEASGQRESLQYCRHPRLVPGTETLVQDQQELAQEPEAHLSVEDLPQVVSSQSEQESVFLHGAAPEPAPVSTEL